MLTFLLAVALLIGGYVVYGAFVEKVFGIDENRPTPATTMADGVDFAPIEWKRIFLIQFLNIAGLGPIFGAILGALWGPVSLLWIVFGCIFAGAVHDYFSGMLSLRHKGASVSELVGFYLGDVAKQVMRVFSVVLLVLVGVVFITGPANLLGRLTPERLTPAVWVWVIIAYYILATMLPIDKFIAKIYPVFGLALLFMAVGIGGAMIWGHLAGTMAIPEMALANLHPRNLPIWPLMFITIACGAISGFHATQSPMMARCMTNEKYGRRVFYGSMIAEGFIALIWATIAFTFFGGTPQLQAGLGQLGAQAGVVHHVSVQLLGALGGVLAVLGVVACPITSGDTAFRSARLTIADVFKINQTPIVNRFAIALPLFAVGYWLTTINFQIVWRYFAWSNQTLAMLMLWAAAVYLKKMGKLHWICTAPATFMTAVSITYILQAPEGFGLATSISYPVGALAAVLALAYFMYVKFAPMPIEPGLAASGPKPPSQLC